MCRVLFDFETGSFIYKKNPDTVHSAKSGVQSNGTEGPKSYWLLLLTTEAASSHAPRSSNALSNGDRSVFQAPMHSHTDATTTHNQRSDDSFDPSLCQWETDEQWQQCYDHYMDILWDDDSDIQEKVNARLTLYGRLRVVRPYEEEDSPWWSANNNPKYVSYSRQYPSRPRPLTKPPTTTIDFLLSDGEDADS